MTTRSQITKTTWSLQARTHWGDDGKPGTYYSNWLKFPEQQQLNFLTVSHGHFLFQIQADIPERTNRINRKNYHKDICFLVSHHRYMMVQKIGAREKRV